MLHSIFCILLVGAASGLVHGQEPRSFIPAADVRPIGETPPAAPLRWRAKPRPTVDSTVEYTEADPNVGADRRGERSAAPAPLRAGWNVTRIDPSVRPAQAVESDPFSDPFSDRKSDHARTAAAAEREPLILQPTNAEAGVEELPPPRPLPQPRRVTRPDPLRMAQQPSGTERSLLPSGQPAMDPVGAPPVERSTVPCERVYNDRNCCDLELNCHDFRQRLLSDSIRNISLDISAPFDRDPEKTPEQNEAERIEKFRLLEFRQWRNRRGQVIATGRLSNIQNNAVVLVDESGRETARVQIGELGEDEICYVTAWWRLPAECPLGGIRTSERKWAAAMFPFHASALCHKPLYFEQVQLERYGHTAGPIRQPLLSGAHFFVSLAALPYKMAINPPTECQYALGYYRPGNCAPWMIEPIPLSLRGAAAEIGVALGLVYVIP